MPTPITLPVTAEQIRKLKAGDEILVSGRIITAREAAHRYLLTNDDRAVREIARGSFIYHCGPVVTQDPGTKEWRFVAAGPATSLRQEPYEPEVIARYGIRGVIGKGGMGPGTLEALREHGAVYLHAGSGLAVALARCITRVHGVHKLDELGIPEAIWIVEVKDFPAVVTMDSHGETLHAPGEAETVAREVVGGDTG